MTETKEKPPRNLKRSFVMMVFLVSAVTLFGLFGLFATATNEMLIVTCVGEGGRLSPGFACAYLKQVRDPDPNQPVSTSLSQPQTIFGFFLAGYEASNPRSVNLLEHFLGKDIRWDDKHSNAFSPLYLAILDQQETLVKRFLDAGASPQKPIDAPGKRFHGMNTLDFTRLLKAKTNPEDPGGTAAKLARIEKMLLDAGAKATPTPEPAPTADAGPAADAGPTPNPAPQK
jgi:hypothetical protein